MDIKDLILIVGGLLIAAVIAHGLWIAWRARRDPLRLDLVTDLPPADADDIRHLHSELPNGGSRVIEPGDVPRQEALALGEAAEEREAAAPRTQRREPRLDPGPASGSGRPRREPGITREAADDLPPQPDRPEDPERAAEAAAGSTQPPEPAEAAATPVPRSRQRPEPDPAEAAVAEQPRADQAGARPPDRVADVIMPERASRLDEPKEPRRWARKVTGESAEERSGAERRTGSEPRGTADQRAPADAGARPGGRKRLDSRRNSGDSRRAADAGSGVGRTAAGKGGDHRVEAPVQELIMINLLAPKGNPFTGAGLVESLRARGLRYGDMNIFHRQDPVSRTSWYSVANVVEPGTFDMTDLENFRSPGVCFFLQLPGPENPLEVFEDMLKVARDVAVRVGGELKDEQRSVMTGQTVEHYRQRISEFCRRRMSMRA